MQRAERKEMPYPERARPAGQRCSGYWGINKRFDKYLQMVALGDHLRICRVWREN